MGQKVNPHGMRVGVIKDWDSRWYARDEKVGDLIVEDYKIREYLKKTLYSAGIPNIEIERDSAKVRIYIHCSRPASRSPSPSWRSARPIRTLSSSLRTSPRSSRSASASAAR